MYRSAFYRGEIHPGDAAKAVYILRTLAEVIEATDFEERLQQLEAQGS